MEFHINNLTNYIVLIVIDLDNYKLRIKIINDRFRVLVCDLFLPYYNSFESRYMQFISEIFDVSFLTNFPFFLIYARNPLNDAELIKIETSGESPRKSWNYRN